MSDELKSQVTEDEPIEPIKSCRLKVVETPKGKRFEVECVTKEAAREFADLLEEEVIIRVKPKGAVLEEEPVT